MMMKAMVDSNIFIGYITGMQNPTVVSNLQFFDDALLYRGKSWANFRALIAGSACAFGGNVGLEG